MHYSMVKSPCSNFRVITAKFSGIRIFRIFTVLQIVDEGTDGSKKEKKVQRKQRNILTFWKKKKVGPDPEFVEKVAERQQHVDFWNIEKWHWNWLVLTHISLASHFWDIGKQCRPRSDTPECGVWSGSSLLANRNIYSKQNKNEKNT